MQGPLRCAEALSALVSPSRGLGLIEIWRNFLFMNPKKMQITEKQIVAGTMHKASSPAADYGEFCVINQAYHSG
jgi:hypothetical protein